MVQILDSALGHVVVGAVHSCSSAHYGEMSYMLQRAFDLTVEVSMQPCSVWVHGVLCVTLNYRIHRHCKEKQQSRYAHSQKDL